MVLHGPDHGPPLGMGGDPFGALKNPLTAARGKLRNMEYGIEEYL